MSKYTKMVFSSKSCQVCRKEFVPKHKNQKNCSDKCRIADAKKIYENKRKNFEYSEWDRLRFKVFQRDSFTCQYCGRNVLDDKIILHCDHITPKSDGGTNEENNLVTSCKECNVGKSDILLEENFKVKLLKKIKFADGIS